MFDKNETLGDEQLLERNGTFADRLSAINIWDAYMAKKTIFWMPESQKNHKNLRVNRTLIEKRGNTSFSLI